MRWISTPRRVCTTLAILAALALAAGSAAAVSAAPASHGPASHGPASGPVSTATAVNATNALALAGLRRLNPAANTVFSPLSIATALAMVDQGAGGATRRQLDTLLGDAASPAALAAADHGLAAALHTAVTGYGAGGPTLDSANALWLQSGLTLVPGFASTLATDFAAPPRQTDFAGDPTGATQAINAWVSQHTDAKIPTLMTPGEITAQTNLVLANAVYLNARWQTPFDPNRTTPGAFTTAGGRVTVPFMDSGELTRFPYAEVSGYQAVALPYAHSSLQFLAVMAPVGRLTKLEDWLSPPHLSALTHALHTRAIDLSMPKFTFAFAASLNGFLAGLGLTSAFGPAAQLDGLIRGRDLAIQAVQHAATLAVAESGTVAAAATGVSVAPTAIAADAMSLELNHPFVVLIRDTTTGAILFAARVLDPA